MTSSQFDILNNLQKNKSLQMDILPQLRLTPPAIYHEKVQKGPVSSTRELQDTALKKEKKSIKRWQLNEPKSKGLLPSRIASSLFSMLLLYLLQASIIINWIAYHLHNFCRSREEQSALINVLWWSILLQVSTGMFGHYLPELHTILWFIMAFLTSFFFEPSSLIRSKGIELKLRMAVKFCLYLEFYK